MQNKKKTAPSLQRNDAANVKPTKAATTPQTNQATKVTASDAKTLLAEINLQKSIIASLSKERDKFQLYAVEYGEKYMAAQEKLQAKQILPGYLLKKENFKADDILDIVFNSPLGFGNEDIWELKNILVTVWTDYFEVKGLQDDKISNDSSYLFNRFYTILNNIEKLCRGVEIDEILTIKN